MRPNTKKRLPPGVAAFLIPHAVACAVPQNQGFPPEPLRKQKITENLKKVLDKLCFVIYTNGVLRTISSAG